MNAGEAAWHLLNFLAPAAVAGALSAALAKLIWREALRGVGWLRLAAWAGGGCALALLGGLLLWGRDGRMATYGAMLIADAAGLWIGGMRRRG